VKAKMIKDDLTDHTVLLGINPAVIQMIERQLNKGIFTHRLKKTANDFICELEKSMETTFDSMESEQDRRDLADQINNVSIAFEYFMNDNFRNK
jgi:catalase (peroxidase I)